LSISFKRTCILGVILTCFSTSLLADYKIKQDFVSSTQTKSYYHCELKGGFDFGTKAYTINRPNLTYPQRNFSAWKFVGKEKYAPELPSFDGVHAFADLGGDGVYENITFITTYKINPDPFHPVFIWDEVKDDKDGANEFGLGSLYGIELTYKNLSKILVGDLNNDLIDDLVFLEYGEHDFEGHKKIMGGSIDVAISNSSNKSYSVQRLDADDNLWHNGVLFDINSDGNIDIVAVGGNSPNSSKSQSENFINIMINNGDGSFSKSEFDGGTMLGALAVAAADLDGDDSVDLVIATSKQHYKTSSTVHVFWGDGSKPFRQKVSNWKSDPITDITFADFNKDDFQDVVLLIGGNNYENNVIEVMYMEGRDTLGFDTIFNQPKSSTFGKFLPLSDIYSCNNRIYIFDNSSMSKNSFFEVRID
jgi:hypothetical protein